MESGILQQARELAEKIDNGTLSKEEVAAVLSKVPELASVLVDNVMLSNNKINCLDRKSDAKIVMKTEKIFCVMLLAVHFSFLSVFGWERAIKNNRLKIVLL